VQSFCIQSVVQLLENSNQLSDSWSSKWWLYSSCPSNWWPYENYRLEG